MAKVYHRAPVDAWHEEIHQMENRDFTGSQLHKLYQHKEKLVNVEGELGRADAIETAEFLCQQRKRVRVTHLERV